MGMYKVGLSPGLLERDSVGRFRDITKRCGI